METAAQTTGLLIVGVGIWLALLVAIFTFGPMAAAAALIVGGVGLYQSPKITLGSFAIVAIPVVIFFHII